MKGFDFRVRRLAALAVAVLTAALYISPPFSALGASASTDETLGGGQRPAISLDLTRLFGAPENDAGNAGRVIMPGGAAVGVAMTTRGVLVVGLGEGAGMQAGIRAPNL